MKRKIAPLFCICALCAMVGVGFDVGKKAFTTHYETALLQEPQPLAASIATLPFSTSVQILSLQGKWANVSAGTNAGWIYVGNLSENKPYEDTSIKGLQTGASETTVAAAARPLDNVTKQFAEQEGLNQAAADVQWFENESDKINAQAVTQYLKSNKKGPYQ